MKTNHTPGPWKAAWLDVRLTVEATGRKTICTMDNHRDQEQDARLIAAAPDLLNACRSAFELLLDPNAEPGQADAVGQILYEAIAKAEGGA